MPVYRWYGVNVHFVGDNVDDTSANTINTLYTTLWNQRFFIIITLCLHRFRHPMCCMHYSQLMVLRHYSLQFSSVFMTNLYSLLPVIKFPFAVLMAYMYIVSNLCSIFYVWRNLLYELKKLYQGICDRCKTGATTRIVHF